MRDKHSPLLIIAAVTIITFLPHLTGHGVFVGDSDRMNHSLTVFAAYVKAFSEHTLPLWNDAVFGGYSLVALPYDYPNPIALLAALLGVHDIYLFAGLESAALFFCAGVATYYFLLSSGHSPHAACVGAVLYQTCALPVLKVAQNDMSFMVIVLIPVLMLLIRRSAERVSAWNYVFLFTTVAVILNFTFLQKAAYAGLLAGAYVLWLSVRRRSWQPIVICGLAVLPAVIIAIPRILTIADDFGQATRYYSFAINDFNSIYNFLGFSKIELLRWFDERIFGATFESMAKLGNSFNLHEGFLLFATSFGPFLLAYVLVSRSPWRRKEDDAIFFVFALAAILALVLTKTGYWLLWKLFFQVDFIHLRLLVIAVLPYCALMALVIDMIDDDREPHSSRASLLWLSVVSVAAGAFIVVVEFGAWKLSDKGLALPISDSRRFLDYGALLRIGASVLALIVLWQLGRRKVSRETIRYALAALIVTQGTVFAATSVWGPGHWPTPAAFKSPTRLMGKPGDYRTPSPEAKQALRDKLDADHYRTAFVCPPQDIAIFCSTHIANFWSLRSLEGYVSTLPARIADLPWNENVVTLRAISHLAPSLLDWSLLGLFNVRYAVMYRPELLTNAVREKGQPLRELSPKDVTILENPLPVAPRLFFVKNVKAAKDASTASAILFPQRKTDPAGYHPDQMSVAEGLAQDHSFPTDGTAIARFDRGRIVAEIAPHSQEQFLALNERYDPNWVARTEAGTKLQIMPTNIVMQGVVVPPQTRRVTFTYEPFMIRPKALLFYLCGLALALLAAGAIWRLGRTGKVRSA